MSTAYLRNTYSVAVQQFTGSNIEDVEALLGPDTLAFVEGVLSVGHLSGRVVIPVNHYIIATPPTEYVAYVAPDPDADPDPIEEVLEVPYVPGVFIEEVSSATLAANYTIDT